jgi:RNA polymerase sigma factor (sigma-70 family)
MQRLIDLLPAAERESPEWRAAAKERARILRSCLLVLPVRQRALLQLRYGQSYTLAMIAKHFGVGEPAVHAMHQRAIRGLRGALHERRILTISDLL